MIISKVLTSFLNSLFLTQNLAFYYATIMFNPLIYFFIE